MRYERIGDIAVIRIPGELDRQENEIAQHILERDHSINVVLRTYGRSGEFRNQLVKVLVGDRTDTIHTEFGVKIHVDVREVYFSEKEKTERQRLKNLVSDGERILVLFSGVGAIPLLIAKEKNVTIVAVEKNKIAFSFMEENIAKNSLKGIIIPVLQDVYTVEREEFDRVIAPQPYLHHSFWYVKNFVKQKGFLHYYTWQAANQDLPPFPGFYIRFKKLLSSYAPKVWKVCIDMQRV